MIESGWVPPGSSHKGFGAQLPLGNIETCRLDTNRRKLPLVNSDLMITLIGMPGSGKSTVGGLLSQQLNLERVDTDRLIESQEKQTLQQIMDKRGNANFRAIEEQVLTEMPLFPCIISTGGSVVYSDKIMRRLRAVSTVVYLRARFETIEYRVSLDPQRGIAADGSQSLRDIYDERIPLYERYNAFAVDCDNASPEALAETIIGHLTQTSPPS